MNTTRRILLIALIICVNVCLIAATERRSRLRSSLQTKGNGSACPASVDQVFPACWGDQRNAILAAFQPGATTAAFCKQYKYTGDNTNGEPAYQADGCLKKDDWWTIKYSKRVPASCEKKGFAWYAGPPAAGAPLLLGMKNDIVPFLQDTKASGEAAGFKDYSTTHPKKWQVLNIAGECYSQCVNLAFVLCALHAALPGQTPAQKNKLRFVTDPATIDGLTYGAAPKRGCGATNNEYCFLKLICKNWSKMDFKSKDLFTCDLDSTKFAAIKQNCPADTKCCEIASQKSADKNFCVPKADCESGFKGKLVNDKMCVKKQPAPKKTKF